MDLKQLTSLVQEHIKPGMEAQAHAIIKEVLGDNGKLDVSDASRLVSKLTGVLKPGASDLLHTSLTKLPGLGDITGGDGKLDAEDIGNLFKKK